MHSVQVIVISMSSFQNLITVFAGIVLRNNMFTFNVFFDVARLADIETVIALPSPGPKTSHFRFNNINKIYKKNED